MKLDRNFVLLFILNYPLVIGLPFIPDSIGLSLNIYYFTIPLFLLFIIVLLMRKRKTLHRGEVGSLLILAVLVTQSAFFLKEITFPIIFFMVLIVSIIGFNNLEGRLSGRMILFVAILYLIVSVVAFASPGNFILSGRFSGFTVSASIYSTFITAIYIVFHINCSLSIRRKAFIYFGFLLLILFSETRLNLLLFLLLPLIIWLSKQEKLKLLALLIFIVGLNLAYPLYNRIVERPNVITTFRYADGRDASFELRYELFAKVWQQYSSLTFSEKLLGKGPEASRILIKNSFGDDHMPHQDFMRLLYDFGLLGMSIFIFFIIQQAITNEVSYSLAYLYFVSFFHNMVFNLFVVLLLILFASISLNNSKVTQEIKC